MSEGNRVLTRPMQEANKGRNTSKSKVCILLGDNREAKSPHLCPCGGRKLVDNINVTCTSWKPEGKGENNQEFSPAVM
jgi:hypothetical protein